MTWSKGSRPQAFDLHDKKIWHGIEAIVFVYLLAKDHQTLMEIKTYCPECSVYNARIQVKKEKLLKGH